MTVYRVIRKSDEVEVYRYGADAPIEWDAFPYADYDHEAVVEDPVSSPEDPPGAWHITKLAFRSRFTAAEKTALELAALHNASLAINHAANLLAAGVRAAMADQRDATYIDLKREDTRSGVQMLEQAGLIAAGRAAEILDARPAESELYRG